MAYQRPMVTVDQNMTISPTSLERDQPAFVFGPNYELHRYGDADEKEGTYAGAYDGAPLNLRYPGVIDEEAVDKGYTKLFGDNVVVALTNKVDAEYADSEINDVQCGKLTFDQGDAKIVVGTMLRITVDGDGSSSGSGSGGNANSEIFTKVIANVKAADVTPSIQEGVYIEDQLADIGAGDTIQVQVVDVVNGVEFARTNYVAQTGYQWDQPNTTLHDSDTNTDFYGVKVNKLYANLRYEGDPENGEYYEVVSADLYITFRELVTTYSDALHSVVGASDVANQLGAVSPDNPLAMGVHMAALNAATDDGDEAPPVYFMAVPSDDLDGYNKVLSRASLTDRIYVLAPTTQDDDVLEAVRTHVLAMSVKTVKRWRIAAASAKVPTTVNRLNKDMNPSGDNYYAIALAGNLIKVVKNSSSTEGNPNTAFRTTLVKGDTVLFNFAPNGWSEEVPQEYTVKRVKNNYMVEVEETLTPSNTPTKVEIYHTYTDAELADVVAALSKSMASRRMLNVFPNRFVGNGMSMTGEFAACAVAGLVSATEPQQPITNLTVRGIDDVPLVYQTFSNAQLDTMAAGGTFIIAQDMPNDLVYVRHQITTAYPDGNINTAELSITKNVDSVSYAFSDLFEPYYGKNNITDELIAILYTIATQLIEDLGNATSSYGPQVISADTLIKYVKRNEINKDHVDIAISLAVPYPCNNIDIVLTV